MAPQSELREEQTLQAVVLTQCEQDYGAPVTQEGPKVLVPLANTPLLDYTLDWLERCGVDEAIVYAKADAHLEMIRQHCQRLSGRRGKAGGMAVTVVALEGCNTMGDALRDLYSKSLVKGDFILVQGDTVATVDLRALVARHRESRAVDKSVIMTCAYLNTLHTATERATTATLLVSAASSKLLHHRRRGPSSTSLAIPTELFHGDPEVLVYPTVYDPNLAVCSEAVPSLFSDNFDYGSRDSLVRGVIEQEEMLGYTIRCQVLEEGYAARATSLAAYQRVSGEVVQRRAYPMVSEVSLTSNRIRYTHDPFTDSYWDPSAKFPRGSGGTGVVVGAGTEVSATASLRDTVIGEHCFLGDGVTASAASIMNNVTIKGGCVLEQCWLGDNVVLEAGVWLSPGCVLGAGVTLGPDITIPPGTLLSARPPLDEFNPGAVQEPDPAVCGVKGRAFVVEQEEEEEEEEGDEEEEEEGASDGDLSGAAGDESDDSLDLSDEEENQKGEFRREVEESLTTALREGCAAPDNVTLEINASRHAYNIRVEDLLSTVTQGVIRAGECKVPGGSSSAEGLWQGVKQSLATFNEVLRKYVKKGRDQMLMLNAIEALVQESPRYLPVAKRILFELNQTHEILDDQVVVHWYQAGGAATPAFPALKASITKFVEWLEEDDSEDEDDDEDSS